MLIRVQYHDNRYDMVKNIGLEELITSKQISRFQRCDGWVTIGVDQLRGTKPDVNYCGPERRNGARAPAQAETGMSTPRLW